MEEIEKMEQITSKAEVSNPISDSLVKQTYGNFMSDTPKWAKIVRFIGIGIGAVGGALLAANPVTLPAALITAAPYMTLFGNFTALFIQGFSKNK